MSKHTIKNGCNDCHKDNKHHKDKNCREDKHCKKENCKFSALQYNLTSNILGYAKVQNDAVVGSFGITTVKETTFQVGNCEEFEEFLWVANRFSQTLTKHNLKGDVLEVISTAPHYPLAVIANRDD